MAGTVIRWGKYYYYLEVVHASPARPSSRSSMKMKMYEQDGTKIYIYIIQTYINMQLLFHRKHSVLALEITVGKYMGELTIECKNHAETSVL